MSGEVIALDTNLRREIKRSDELYAENVRMRCELARLGGAILNYHDTGRRPTKDELWAMYSWVLHGLSGSSPPEGKDADAH